MVENTTPIDGLVTAYFRPGMRAWFCTQRVNDKGRLVEQVYGIAGDITYVGFAQVANATYLVFDRVEGAGKKAKTEQFAVNASHCPHIGPYIGR